MEESIRRRLEALERRVSELEQAVKKPLVDLNHSRAAVIVNVDESMRDTIKDLLTDLDLGEPIYRRRDF